MYDHIIMQLKVSLSALKYDHSVNTLKYEYSYEDRARCGDCAASAILKLESAISNLENVSETVEDTVERMLRERGL
jgi:hypothetical protein